MTEPNFELPDVEKKQFRPIMGWIAIGLVMLALTLQQFVGYMQRDSASEGVSINEYDSRLRTLVKMSSFETGLSELSGTSSKDTKPSKKAKGSDRALETLANEISKHKKKELSFVLLYVIVQHERGQPQAPSDIEALRKDGSPRRGAAAKIYSGQELDAKAYESLAIPFKNEFFADTLVKIHLREMNGDLSYRKEMLGRKASSTVLAFFALILASIVGFGLLIAYAVAKAQGKLKPLGHPSGSLTFAQADGNAMRTAQMLIGLFGGQIVALALLSPFAAPREIKALVSFGASLLIAYWMLRIPIHGHRVTLDQVGLHRRDLGKNVLWGVGGALANLPLLFVAVIVGNIAFQWLPPARHPVQDELVSGASGATLALIFLSAAVFAPIFEEIAFRGTFLPALVKKFGGPAAGILACGICFAIIHPTGVPAWPPLAVMGMVAAQLTYQCRSLVPAIAMHAVHNGGILTFSLIALA